MKKFNLIDVLLWSFRRNENDVVKLYNSLSDVMRLSTGGNMLNFGFWDETTITPLDAQKKLCMIFGNFSNLTSGLSVLDIGSGLSAPALTWAENFENLKIVSVNINPSQLLDAKNYSQNLCNDDIRFVNSTATLLPFNSESVDRILALESAQHFKPLKDFFSECYRILKDDGMLSLAIPIMSKNFSSPLVKLGLLSITWSSEHYSSQYIMSHLHNEGFTILETQLIGSNVYSPMADYYLNNRDSIRSKIIEHYPSYVENILYRSIKKMKETSNKQVIDYLLVSCKKLH